LANIEGELLDLLSHIEGGGENQGLTCLDIGVDDLKGGDANSLSLAGRRRGLRDNILAFDDSISRMIRVQSMHRYYLCAHPL
jgi:hypothetical protein